MSEESSNPRKRRGLGVVTPNACTECRKKRAKCDGKEPCGRCQQNNTQCIYELPVRQTKEEMRSELDVLRRHQQQSERVLGALAAGENTQMILSHLQNRESMDSLLQELEKSTGKAVEKPTAEHERPSIAQPNPSFYSWHWQQKAKGDSGGSSERSSQERMDWTPESRPASGANLKYPMPSTWTAQPARQESSSAVVRTGKDNGREMILNPGFGLNLQPAVNYSGSWTAVCSDGDLVEHLLALYFCWEYPTFASLSKEHFLDDFRNGRQRHCSSLLVNALLAVGCRFSHRIDARGDPNDKNTSGDHFFAEAMRLLDAEEDLHKLTTIQALGLMSIREASRGRTSVSLYLSGQSIRLAIEMGLHQDFGSDTTVNIQDEEMAVRAATFWGAFSLDQAWSISIGRLPHYSRNLKVIAKPAIIDHIEAASWIPYTDDAPIEQFPTQQPSNVRSVYKTFCELSEIVHHSLYAYYTPGKFVTSQTLLRIYRRYLDWYDQIPNALRLGQNFTPAVLFAHMYYHYAILLLFRPFIKLELVGSTVSPREICRQAGEAICALANSYSKLYTLERTPSFVPYFVLTAGITHLVSVGNGWGGREPLVQSIEHLKSMANGHGVADRAIDIVRQLAAVWGIDIDIDDEGKLTDKDPDEPEQKEKEKEKSQDIVNRVPSPTSTHMFNPDVKALDSVSSFIRSSEDDNSPLFWTFPLQGRPFIPTDTDQLEQAGFKVLTTEPEV
ncbi:fungal-specific transcription factor domain-containing protein [Xylogone sp. PMI_703]|nr:fungal-specific transcription factor domain-containing protein [Xylogone sp. PMI_703]